MISVKTALQCFAGLSLTVLMCASGDEHIANAAQLDRPYFRASAVVIVIGGNDFSESGGTAPVAVDFNLLDNVPSGNAANDIITADGVTMNYNTGQWNTTSNGSDSGYEFDIQNQTFGGSFTSTGPHQTLDANDSYSAFGLKNTTDVDINTENRVSQFLVASNTAFDIYARASDLVATGDFSAYDYSNILYTLKIRVKTGTGIWRAGLHAQNPSNGGSGIIRTVKDLDDMSSAPTKVFDGGRKTAKSRGALLQQAVGFRSLYRLRGAGTAINDYDLSMGAGALGATVTYTIYTP